MTLDTSKLNKHDAVYHGLTYDILTSPQLNFRPAKRTVIDTIGVFGNQVEYDLSDGSIPLSCTKPIPFKSALFPEIVGFLRNETNLKWYLDQGMKIWTPNAFNFYRRKLSKKHPWKDLEKDSPAFHEAMKEYEQLVLSGDDSSAGDLGMFYPAQWRSFRGVGKVARGFRNYVNKILSAVKGEDDAVEVDQISDLIRGLKENPSSRYHLVSAWNPFDVKYGTAALAPCHCLFQAYRYTDVEGEERLDLKLYQRSADELLGVAFNAPQYATLTSVIADLVGVKPGRFIHSFGDLHLYAGRGDRSDWYKDRQNLSWLQKNLEENTPETVLAELLDRLPDEGDYQGYDHIPFALEQLSRESTGEPPMLKTKATSIDDIVVDDLEVIGYDKPERLRVNGQLPKMAS